MAQHDATRGVLDRSRQEEVRESVERVVADLSDHADIDEQTSSDPSESLPSPTADTPRRRVLCVAGRSPLDAAACAILAQLLEARGASPVLAGPEALTSRGIFALRADDVGAVSIVYLDPKSLASVRFGVRRLRKKFPGVPIAVCMWRSADLSAAREAAKADATVGTLSEAIAFCAPSESCDAIDPPHAPPALATVAG